MWLLLQCVFIKANEHRRCVCVCVEQESISPRGGWRGICQHTWLAQGAAILSVEAQVRSGTFRSVRTVVRGLWRFANVLQRSRFVLRVDIC